MVLIVMLRERKLLLAIRRLIRMVYSKDHGGRGLSGTGDEVGHQSAGEPREGLAVDAGFQPGEGGATGQVLRWLQGRPLAPECAHRVTTETVGIIGVRIPRGTLIDALGSQVPYGVINRGRMALIMNGDGETLGQPNLPVNTPEPEGPKV
jgi:hypothetical protein